MPTIPEVIPFLALIIYAVALFRNNKADTKQDAGQMMEIIVKLETINENVKEVKSDMKDVKADMEKVKERLVIVEQSTRSAHRRIDNLHGETEGGTL